MFAFGRTAEAGKRVASVGLFGIYMVCHPVGGIGVPETPISVWGGRRTGGYPARNGGTCVRPEGSGRSMNERNLRASISQKCDGGKKGGRGHIDHVYGVAGQGNREKGALRHKFAIKSNNWPKGTVNME